MSETASLLAQHYTHTSGRGLTTVCKCGEVLGERTGTSIGMSNLHRAHVAAILDAHFAERERALVERAACWSPGGPCPAGQTVCETCGPCNHCAALTRPATEGEGA